MSSVKTSIKKMVTHPKDMFKGESFGDVIVTSWDPGTAGLTSGGMWAWNKYKEAVTPDIPDPKPVVSAEEPDVDTTTKEAAYSEADRIRKKKGLRSTQLTGPSGITNSPTTLKARLG